MKAPPRVPRERLDRALVARGHAESRQKAQALIMAGSVRLEDERVAKPGTLVSADTAIEVAAAPGHVGRGALKLGPILKRFAIDARGLTALDIGASTGGFTEVLLAAGAARVYAVDVGRGQLHERLRTDPRVLVRDRVNARTLSAAVIPERAAIATIDVSFISAVRVLEGAAAVLAAGAHVVCLVKPQFEVGRGQVGKGGLVKDAQLHRQCLSSVARRAQELGYSLRAAAPSPITGSEGNREFFLHLVFDSGSPAARAEEIERMADRAVSE